MVGAERLAVRGDQLEGDPQIQALQAQPRCRADETAEDLVFHFVASMFSLEIHFSNPTPVVEIRQLRSEGGSLAEVAQRAGTTVAKVRRLVPRIDKSAQRRRQEETARAIDALPLTRGEKAERWKGQTGQSETTFWRVLKRLSPGG